MAIRTFKGFVDRNGNKCAQESGSAPSGHDITKADKVANATNGHLAALDGDGNLTDGGDKSQFAEVQHSHSEYAAVNHNHDSAYAAANHNHDTAYAALNHNHDSEYAAVNHNHDSVYAPLVPSVMASLECTSNGWALQDAKALLERMSLDSIEVGVIEVRVFLRDQTRDITFRTYGSIRKTWGEFEQRQLLVRVTVDGHLFQYEEELPDEQHAAENTFSNDIPVVFKNSFEPYPTVA